MNFACGEEYQKHIGEQLDENLWVKDRAGLSFAAGEAGRVRCHWQYPTAHKEYPIFKEVGVIAVVGF